MKTAVVLSGGGAKGSFQVGVLEKLIASGITPDIYYGTSVGAINSAGMIFEGIAPLKLNWLAINGRSDVLSSNWWKLLWSEGLYSTAPLRKMLDAYQNSTPTAEAVACTVSIYTGEIAYVSSSQAPRSAYLDAVQASSAIPFIMDSVKGWVDGGTREQTPLKKAIDDGADVIYAILCNPYAVNPTDVWNPYFPKLYSIGMRALDLMEHEIFLNDVQTCVAINKNPGANQRVVDLKVFAAPRLYMDTIDFDPARIREAIQGGNDAWDQGPIQL